MTEDTSFSNMKNQRRKFTPEEDEQLRRLVEENGAHKWDYIATSMPGRTGRQCRDRYQNYLCPGISRDEWTAEEERLLIEKHAEFGSHWAKMTRFFPGRTGTALKNRWNYYVSRQNMRVTSPEEPPSEDTTASPPVSDSGEMSPIDQIFAGLSEQDRWALEVLEYDPLFLYGTSIGTLCYD